MKKTANTGEKAAEFLKQWQDQMTRQMRDPDMIRAMLAAMQSFGGPRHDENARKPATAPNAGDDAIARLERRVDALERELAKLSAGAVSMAAKTKKSAGTGKRRRAKPVAANKRTMAKRAKSAAGKKVPGKRTGKR